MSNPFRAYAHQDALQPLTATVPPADSCADPLADPDFGRRIHAWETRWISVIGAVMAEADIIDPTPLTTRLVAVDDALAMARVPEREVHAFFAELCSVLGPNAPAGVWMLPTGEALRLPSDNASLRAVVRLCHDLVCAIRTDNGSLARNAVQRLFMLCEIAAGSFDAASIVDGSGPDPHHLSQASLPVSI